MRYGGKKSSGGQKAVEHFPIPCQNAKYENTYEEAKRITYRETSYKYREPKNRP